jgi:flavin-dependent dehydrogenase
MKDRYDVVVIGAGPSGLLAAKALKETGFDVALIDRKDDVTKAGRSCGNTILPPNEYFFGDLFHYNEKDRRFCCINCGMTFPYTGSVNKIYTWHLYSPGMKHIQFGTDEETTHGKAPIALSYDKDIMLECLVNDITSDHVEIFAGCEFRGIRWEGYDVVIEATGKTFRSTYVIAADGCNSRVVEQLGYNTNRRHIANLYVKSYFLKGFNPPHGNALITAIMHIQGKPLYLFFIPRPDGTDWNLLMLTLEEQVDLNAAYGAAASDQRFAAWFKGAQIVREFGAFEHIFSPIVKPFRNNVIIAGDAGSCQELECLGALITGWKAGLAAGGAIKEQQLSIPEQSIQRYQDWWLEAYIKQYDYQDYLMMFGMPYVFPSSEVIDYIFEQLSEPFPPTFNPYTIARCFGQRLQEILPKIMAERPDILMQMAPNMFTFASNILSQTLKK